METVQISHLYIMGGDYKTTKVIVQRKNESAINLEVKTSALAKWLHKKQPSSEFPYLMSRLTIYTPEGGKSVHLKKLTRGTALSLLNSSSHSSPQRAEIPAPQAHRRIYQPVPCTV